MTFFFVAVSSLPLLVPEMLQYLRENFLTVDLETMNPVQMPTTEAKKLEAMFPYPAANVMAEHYVGPRPKPSEFVNALIVSDALFKC